MVPFTGRSCGPSMIFLYTLSTTFLLILLAPLLLPLVVWKKKYRLRTLRRLGPGLNHRLQLPDTGRQRPVIWLHALSVGEVTSALPLVRGLRQHLPAATLVFSAATKSGRQVAEDLIAPHVDLVFDGPLDIYWTIRSYIRLLQPSLFILVETDFWPGWLGQLHRSGTPLLLVNGRISERSHERYRRLAFFFRPMFRCFDVLAMQTRLDATRLARLGIPEQRIMTLGNLKYDTCLPGRSRDIRPITRHDLHLPEHGPLWVCGSTHPGEEELLLTVFAGLREQVPDLRMVIAPRDIGRAGELAGLVRQHGLAVTRRSGEAVPGAVVTILDTIGELTSCYGLATAAFVGGSLVARGGHNPIEPAARGVPVLFGPHMDDFAEIAADLERCGGARTVPDLESMTGLLARLFTDSRFRRSMGRAALAQVEANRGVVARHLGVIDNLLHQKSS